MAPTTVIPTPKLAPTLHGLVERLAHFARYDLPDRVVKLSDLVLGKDGLVQVPGGTQAAMTDWSRRQLANLLGLRWERYVANSTNLDRAAEITRRLRRATSEVRLRFRRIRPEEVETAPHDTLLTAVVTPSYTPVPDVAVAERLLAALGSDAPHALIRADVTDMTTSYVVSLGDRYTQGDRDAAVGCLWGSVLVRNSGVGFSSLFVGLQLVRLLCTNGMTVAGPDGVLMKKRHRGLDLEVLQAGLKERLADIGPALHRSTTALERSLLREVPDAEAELKRLLREARLPAGHLKLLVEAFRKEPLANAFGVSQAITLAAQGLAPEDRFDLEQLAGQYVSN